MRAYIQTLGPPPKWLLEVSAAFPYIEVGEAPPKGAYDVSEIMGSNPPATMSEKEVLASLARDAELPGHWVVRKDVEELGDPGDFLYFYGKILVMKGTQERATVRLTLQDGSHQTASISAPDYWVECPLSFPAGI
jgi:hypothetical protein